MKNKILLASIIIATFLFTACEEDPILPVGQSNYIEADLPVVETGSALNITDNSFEVNGELLDNGGRDILQYGHCYSNSGIPDTTNEKSDFGRTAELITFTSTFDELQSETIYNVRAYAVNEAGIIYGTVIQVQTEGITGLPVVSTGQVTVLGSVTAEITGEILDVGDDFVSQHGHCWSTETAPTLGDDFTELGSTSQTGEFTSQLDNLSPSTTYYVRGYVTSEGNTVYGDQITIFTNPSK